MLSFFIHNCILPILVNQAKPEVHSTHCRNLELTNVKCCGCQNNVRDLGFGYILVGISYFAVGGRPLAHIIVLSCCCVLSCVVVQQFCIWLIIQVPCIRAYRASKLCFLTMRLRCIAVKIDEDILNNYPYNQIGHCAHDLPS
jgi:hypothetical protein